MFKREVAEMTACAKSNIGQRQSLRVWILESLIKSQCEIRSQESIIYRWFLMQPAGEGEKEGGKEEHLSLCGISLAVI